MAANPPINFIQDIKTHAKIAFPNAYYPARGGTILIEAPITASYAKSYSKPFQPPRDMRNPANLIVIDNPPRKSDFFKITPAEAKDYPREVDIDTSAVTMLCCRALRDYKQQSRELGETPIAFPDGGFSELMIASSHSLNTHYPTPEGHYRLSITLNGGIKNEDWYWMWDNPNDEHSDTRKFTLYNGRTGIAIPGFSDSPDTEGRYPDRDGKYWRCIRYDECGQIKEWMEEKYRNYLERIKKEELLGLCTGAVKTPDPKKFEAILRTAPRLLTLPLQGNQTILEIICNQQEQYVKTYLPALLNLLAPKDWQDLIRIYSAQDWLKLVAQTCERCVAFELAGEFLNKLSPFFRVIDPLGMALYALEQQHIGLFRLAVSLLKDVNVQADDDKNTLLHLAAKKGETEMVQCLVERGADLKQRNAAGLKAEHIARLAGFEATADHIAVFKLTPVLKRMGFFDALQRDALAIKMQRIEAITSGPSINANNR